MKSHYSLGNNDENIMEIAFDVDYSQGRTCQKWPSDYVFIEGMLIL